MTDTVFTNQQTMSDQGWFNDVNNVTYRLLGSSVGPGGSAPTTAAQIISNLGVPSTASLSAPGGSSIVGFIQSGTGAIATTVQSKLQQYISSSEFNSLGAAYVAASANFIPLITPSGQTFFNDDPNYLNYSSTRAIAVWQHRDAQNGTSNQLIPGVVFQFNSTGNGVVNSGTESSSTIWQGVFGSQNKTGDGSAHCFTGIGQLGAVGPGGYNELGGFQAQLTNIGSALGNISGVEMLLSDSPNAGVTTFNTRMSAVVGRIAKYNPTIRPAYCFFASSEGTQPPNGIIGVNATGNSFQRGFDFSPASFTTGQFGLAPNNTALAWLDASASAQPILGVSNTNISYFRPASAAASLQLQDFAGVARLTIAGAGGALTFSGQSNSFSRGYVTLQAATYTVLPTDTHITASFAGTITITMPTPSSNTGRELTIRTIQNQLVVSASANIAPLAGGANSTSILPATAGKWAVAVCDGTSWQIQAAN